MKVKFTKPHTHSGQPVELNKVITFPDELFPFFVRHELGEVITPPAGASMPEPASGDAEQEKPPAKPKASAKGKKPADKPAE